MDLGLLDYCCIISNFGQYTLDFKSLGGVVQGKENQIARIGEENKLGHSSGLFSYWFIGIPILYLNWRKTYSNCFK